MNNNEKHLSGDGGGEPVVTGKIGPYANFNGEEYLYFAGNNYLDLARRPELIDAAVEATKNYGTTFGAGRTTTGTGDIHLKLERRLAEFKNNEDAMIYPSGYLGNQILLSGLLRENDTLLCDDWSHPSIIEGLPRSTGEVVMFQHNDMDDLKEKVKSGGHGIILVNGVDPIIGDLAPLDNIMKIIKEKDFRILVDDAHGTGVLGENGRGTPEYFGLTSDKIFQTETMSKALGSYGGFITGNEDFIGELREVASTYRGSTPLPPAVVGASLAAINIAIEEPQLRDRVKENARYLEKKLKSHDMEVNWPGGAIVKLDVSEEISRKIATHLQDRNIIVPYVHYPDLDSPGRLRMTVSAGHSKQDIDYLLKSVIECV